MKDKWVSIFVCFDDCAINGIFIKWLFELNFDQCISLQHSLKVNLHLKVNSSLHFYKNLDLTTWLWFYLIIEKKNILIINSLFGLFSWAGTGRALIKNTSLIPSVSLPKLGKQPENEAAWIFLDWFRWIPNDNAVEVT